MPQARQVPQSTEYLQGVYRALGMSEETLERVLQYPPKRIARPRPRRKTAKPRLGKCKGPGADLSE
jgi:hypothetical protein